MEIRQKHKAKTKSGIKKASIKYPRNWRPRSLEELKKGPPKNRRSRKSKRKTSGNMSEAARKAWLTRKKKYGGKGRNEL